MSESKKVITTLVFIFLAVFINAQVKSIGTPFIRNYSRANYQAGSQTWDIEQGENGMMYFANNNGLLEFDGKYWNVYPLPNNSIIRSIGMRMTILFMQEDLMSLDIIKLAKWVGQI